MQKSGLKVETIAQLYSAVCEQVEDRSSLSAPSASLLEETEAMETGHPEISPPEDVNEPKGGDEVSERMDTGGAETGTAGEVSTAAEMKEEEGGEVGVPIPSLPELDKILSDLSPVELLTRFQKKPPFLFTVPSKVVLLA